MQPIRLCFRGLFPCLAPASPSTVGPQASASAVQVSGSFRVRRPKPPSLSLMGPSKGLMMCLEDMPKVSYACCRSHGQVQKVGTDDGVLPLSASTTHYVILHQRNMTIPSRV
ncbi:hypothetical protein B0T13DRAFT_132850 [Neurospora crassa]|nr:hypothetical protein B0T13DRAFT_132850 [Neurospora crassa]